MPARRWRGAEPPWFQAAANTNQPIFSRSKSQRRTQPPYVKRGRTWAPVFGQAFNTLSAYAQAVIADGATAYYRLSETSAPTLVDFMGRNHGTYSGGVTLNVSGAPTTDPDRAALFDGSSGQASIPDSPTFNPTGPFSLEIWVKRITVAGIIEAMVSKLSVGGNGFWIRSGVSGPKVFIVSFSGTPITSPGTPNTPFNAWSYLVGVYDGSFVRFYLNGVEQGTGTSASGTPDSVSDPLLFATDAGAHISNIQLDEVAFYPTALTAAQVRKHYQLATSWVDNVKSARARAVNVSRRARIVQPHGGSTHSIVQGVARRKSLNFVHRRFVHVALYPPPPPPQINPAFVFGWGQRRTRPPYQVRQRVWEPPWPQLTPPTTPNIVFKWGQRRIQPAYFKRGRVWLPTPAQANPNTNQPFFVNPTGQRWLRSARTWQKRGHLWLPPAVQAQSTPPPPSAQRRTRPPYFKRGHIWLPIPAQVTFVNPNLVFTRPRRIQPPYIRRGRLWLPTPAQVVVPNPNFVFTRPRRLQPPYSRRGHLWAPIPAQVILPNPAFVEGRRRRSLQRFWIAPHRGHVWEPGWGQAIAPPVIPSGIPGFYLPDEALITLYVADEMLITLWLPDEVIDGLH